MSDRRNLWTDDEFQDTYGFDLWSEWGEDNEIFYDDPRLSDMLEQGRVVSLAFYADGNCDCDENGHKGDCDYANAHGYVHRGWARVDVIRRVVLPEGWSSK